MTRIRHTSRHAGFTLMELLVAISVSLGLILFVSQIMGTTSRAVSAGFDSSQLLQSARVATEHLDSDALLMTGPSASGGVIVISNDTVSSKVLPNDSAPTTVRDDQLYFVRERGSLYPVAPSQDDTYSGTSNGASNVRVFYGHGRKINPNGNDGGALGASGVNQYASQWVLVRQALFLCNTAPAFGNYTDNSSKGAKVASGILPASAGTYWANWSSKAPSAPPKKLYGGYCDVALQSLADYHADIEANGPGAYLYTTNSGTDYRLRVNTRPQAGEFEPWRVAQIHPILIENVSDIVVEFAGDYTDNLPSGAPDGAPDGEPDVNASGEIIWYSSTSTPAIPTTDPGWGVLTADTVGTAKVYTFSNSNRALWPYLIRVRYRMHDRNGNMMGVDGEPGRIVEQIIGVTR
ncbi:MAG: prepilin-type N-terminal cleavage/methylation domain-containing protein [Phycisphaera sp.]|nr:prepilin-type N-terminal cleavage/methylation domain-containing protein [Phycisphaera sp.]